MQQSNDPGTPVPAYPGETAVPAVPLTTAHAMAILTGTTELEIHASALIFPPMREAEFDALVEDIRANGQKEPIVTHEGKIIDGRHRYLACQKLGIVPITREWDGNGSLLDFIISANLRRRHLKENQRAMVAARMLPQFEEEALRRMKSGGVLDFDPGDYSPQGPRGRAKDHVGKCLNISGKSVLRACHVLRKGLAELITKVDQGKLAVTIAAKIAELTPDEQQHLLTLDRRELAARFRPAKPARSAANAARRELSEAEVRRDEAFIKAIPFKPDGLKRCAVGLRLKVSKADWYNELAQLFRNPYFPDLLDRGVMVIRSDEPER